MTVRLARSRVGSAAPGLPVPRGRPLIGFGILHAGNTMLNMVFTLLQLLVLARILPTTRYSEVVFLMTIGFYFQPFDQAFGKSSFVALRSNRSQGGRLRPRREVIITLCGQAVVLLLASVVIPSMLVEVGSVAWIEDGLFLFLCLAINFWAFDLQSAAWSVDLNVPFVRLSIMHRLLHASALGIAYATQSLLLFSALAGIATVCCLVAVLRMFARAGLFEPAEATTDWRDYGRIFRTAFLSTLTDFLLMNAPYGLITARFGIGPMLIIFDSVMKLVRIALAGSRTLAEIALPRHSALLAAGDRRAGRSLFLLVAAACLGATSIPALAVAWNGRTVFQFLLGHNDVVPASAMIPAAIVILASGLYQPAIFFLGYGKERGPVLTLSLLAAALLLGFATALYVYDLTPSTVLALFGACLLGIGTIAAIFTLKLFSEPEAGAASGWRGPAAKSEPFAS